MNPAVPDPIPAKEPQGQPRKACGAKTRSGTPCQQTRVAENGRCRMHGGTTPKGIASPHFKTGRWSKYLPATALGTHFQAAYQDRTLMQLRQDVALIDALLTTYTASLKDTGRPLSQLQQTRVMDLLEQKRKHVESEARRLRDLSQVVPIEQYRTALEIVFRLMVEHLADNAVAMGEIQTTARRLLLGKGPVTEGTVIERGE